MHILAFTTTRRFRLAFMLLTACCLIRPLAAAEAGFTPLQLTPPVSARMTELLQVVGKLIDDQQPGAALGELNLRKAMMDLSRLSSYEQELLLQAEADIAHELYDFEYLAYLTDKMLQRENLTEDMYFWALQASAGAFLKLLQDEQVEARISEFLQARPELALEDCLFLASTLKQMNQFERARQYAHQARTIDPDDPDAYMILFSMNPDETEFQMIKAQVLQRFSDSQDPRHQKLVKVFKESRAIR